MYPTKIITITKLDIKEFTDNKKFTVTDHNGDRYNFKEKKADGTNTRAFLAFSNLGVKLNETYEITYNEQRKEFNNHPYTDRVIFDFKPTNGVPMAQDSVSAKSFHTETNNASQGKSDEFWERQAYEKCLSLWTQGMEPETAQDAIMSGAYWTLFKVIKADGAKRFSEAMTKPTNEDLNVEDIPF